MSAPASAGPLLRRLAPSWALAARCTLWLGVLACSRVWTWQQTVPDWLWVATAAAGWACMRATLRARREAAGGNGKGVGTAPAVDAASDAPSTPPWAVAAWAMACATCTYAANLSRPPGEAAAAVVLVGAALYAISPMRRGPAFTSARQRMFGTLALVTASELWVVLVLRRAGADAAAGDLMMTALAWMAGCLSAAGVALLLQGPKAMQVCAGGASRSDGGACALAAPTDTRARWHGRLLVATAACVPLGEGLALVMLGLSGLLLMVRRRALRWDLLRGSATARGMGWAMACWLGAGVLGLGVSGEGWLKPSELGRWVPYFAAVLPILSVGAVPARYFRAAACAFVLGLLVACGLGLLMYGLDLRPGHGVLAFLREPSAQSRVPGSLRSVAGGFYFHRLKMAHVLLVGIACLAVRQVCAPLGPRRRAWELLALTVLGTTLSLTFARGAWLGLATVLAVCLLLGAWRWRALLLAAGLLATLVLVALPGPRARLVSMVDPGASAIRATVWEQAVTVVREHPYGVGLGNYTPLIGRYYERLDNGREFPKTYPHHMILAAEAESGPVGLAAYATAWVIFLQACAAAVRRRADGDDERAAVGAIGLAGGAALWVVGLTHDVLFHNAVALAFCGMAGLVTALLMAPPEPAFVPARRP